MICSMTGYGSARVSENGTCRDLEIRGAGELYGRRQWGLSDIGMDALKNLKLVEAARAEAHALVAEDPTLAHHPLLKSLATNKSSTLHLE